MAISNNEIAIKATDIHKSFNFAEDKKTAIKHLFVSIGKKEKRHRQNVLNGVDITVEKGDFFGIIGRNGSGKSTLLKILAGVYTPDSGSVHINGSLTPFIELGVGFNPELSGRDNVFLSASLLGYTRKQISAMYDDIVAFAELEEHMDKKLKNYSSGMQVRLAFSIAIKAENDILMFDEVLAVGDANFQEKCLNQFRKYKKEGKTIVLVTHAMGTVSEFCNKAALIDNGRIVYSGKPSGAVKMYEKLNQQ